MNKWLEYPIDEKVFYIFTDWASRSVFNKKYKRKTWRYWWKWIWFVYYDEKFKLKTIDKSDYISYEWATNNEMELGACIDWLTKLLDENLENFKKIIIVTDSKYVYNKSFSILRWNSFNNLKTKDWDPIANEKELKKLRKIICKIYQTHRKYVYFDLVKGHSNNENNNKADTSAREWAQSNNRVKLNTKTTRARLFKSKGAKSYIEEIWGKEILIHTYFNKYLWKKNQKDNYEIVSRDNKKFFMKCWRINYKGNPLSSEFIYLVKISNNWHQIEEIIEEKNKEEIITEMLKDWIPLEVFKWKKAQKIYNSIQKGREED